MNLSISFRELLSSSEVSLLLSCFGTFYSPHKSYLCDSDGSVSVIEDFVNILRKSHNLSSGGDYIFPAQLYVETVQGRNMCT